MDTSKQNQSQSFDTGVLILKTTARTLGALFVALALVSGLVFGAFPSYAAKVYGKLSHERGVYLALTREYVRIDRAVWRLSEGERERANLELRLPALRLAADAAMKCGDDRAYETADTLYEVLTADGAFVAYAAAVDADAMARSEKKLHAYVTGYREYAQAERVRALAAIDMNAARSKALADLNAAVDILSDKQTTIPYAPLKSFNAYCTVATDLSSFAQHESLTALKPGGVIAALFETTNATKLDTLTLMRYALECKSIFGKIAVVTGSEQMKAAADYYQDRYKALLGSYMV